MKKFLLIGLPLVLSACTTDVHTYIPSVPYSVTPTPHTYYHPNSNYRQPYYNNQQHHHDHDNYNKHYDNGKHKGQHKNKHKHHDD